MYVCVELVNNTCQKWQEFSLLPPLEHGDGLKIGGLFLLCTVTAWGFREIAMFVLNRR